ncbi:MAG: hypothetical protein KGD67_01200 [Candidatus Lokiarchaeota archaeon]|nr:hypothetical protein [Candidatus Lokiarchaeota archaeon]
MTPLNNEENSQSLSIKKKEIYSDKKREKLNRDELVSNLTGRTLMIYFVLLNKKSIGVRELQRHLDLSSPSVAKYHLEKLVNLHLVENRNGIYYLDKKADLPLLTSWVLLGKQLFPKVLFASILFTSLFIGYLLFVYSYWNKDSMYFIIFGLILMVYIWFEVIMQYKQKPM